MTRVFFSTVSHTLLALLPILSSAAQPEPVASAASSPSVCQAPQKTGAHQKSTHPMSAPDTNIWCGNQTVSVEPLSQPTTNSKTATKEPKDQPFDWNALIRDIAWPVTVLFLVFILRHRLPALIEKILDRIKKVKHKDTELEFLSKEANESLAKAAHGGYVGTLNIDAIFETVKLNEWATLIMSRMLMRKGLVEVVGPNHSFGVSPSLDKLIKHCEGSSLVPDDLLADLERLREVTFFAEWWNGRAPTKGEWKWALANCKSIIERLFDLQAVA